MTERHKIPKMSAVCGEYAGYRRGHFLIAVIFFALGCAIAVSAMGVSALPAVLLTVSTTALTVALVLLVIAVRRAS